ncbi:beta-ketoacyl synthase N-terminal-like domain-containing protein, partial [Gordonia polyisoprenivorans]
MPPETSDRRAIITDALRKIDDLSRKLAIAEQGDREPIAIIGMGCRLPGDVDDPGDYWDLLTEGRSGVVRVPENRWDADEFYAEDHTIPGTIVNRVGGFLTHWDPDEFDAEFFGLTPREAIGMDPQQRLLMEVAWECIEDAGLTRERLRGTATGVYVGMTTNDYTQYRSVKGCRCVGRRLCRLWPGGVMSPFDVPFHVFAFNDARVG